MTIEEKVNIVINNHNKIEEAFAEIYNHDPVTFHRIMNDALKKLNRKIKERKSKKEEES